MTKISYRPKTFSQIVGQEIALKLIKSALSNDKLPRSVILYGPSGVGKTTIARLIAAWYVCERKTDDVCGECAMCQAVQDGTISDILEFDAASNTSVENTREILEQCDYAPQYSSQKVFIIDEAHMLSRNAIAALLKTLEEAPNHVRFILATTEIEKIPDAIRSRCLCIALHDIPKSAMVNYFKTFDAKITDDAIDLLITLSNGSMREALSILNQATLLEDNVTCQTLHSIVSYADDAIIAHIVDLIRQRKFVEVFDKVNNLDESINCLSLLAQITQEIKKRCAIDISEQRTQYIKILIDLNKLHQDSANTSRFEEIIKIGLVEIAYNQSEK